MTDSAPTPVWLARDWIAPGMELLKEGERSGKLYVLREGELEVVRGGVYVNTIKRPGAIFGEMSVLLDTPHSATVRAVTEAEFFVIDNALEVLKSHPDWLLQIATLLAQRLNATTALLTAERRGLAPEDEQTLVLPQNLISQWSDPQV